ncbi:hypothetical protein C7389_103224 [Azoarcus indigens]|uniref:Uncharacterized protein n=1 Tax=Azoarcus indigens TaxID=29545 RepID=A0A4R6ECJ4_9RHOO|nr:hypothetical protein C7389_103224 [Azoarcus indigens]
MPCTVHCLVSDDEQLAPMRERIARAGIADERVYVVWRGPEARTPAGATLRAWGFILAPAAWWWSQAMREWLLATEHVIARPSAASAAADTPAEPVARQPAARARRASGARGPGAAQAAKPRRARPAGKAAAKPAINAPARPRGKSPSKPPASTFSRKPSSSPSKAVTKPGRRGRISGPPVSLSSSACLHTKAAPRLVDKGDSAAGPGAVPGPLLRARRAASAARLARAARLAAARSANGRPPLRLIEGGLTRTSSEEGDDEPQPPAGGGKRHRPGGGRGASQGAGGRTSSTQAVRPPVPADSATETGAPQGAGAAATQAEAAPGTKTAAARPAAPHGGGLSVPGATAGGRRKAAAAAPRGARTNTRTRGGKTGVGAPVPGRGRCSGPA